eukprot:883870-Prymnesium_polylepis.1
MASPVWPSPSSRPARSRRVNRRSSSTTLSSGRPAALAECGGRRRWSNRRAPARSMRPPPSITMSFTSVWRNCGALQDGVAVRLRRRGMTVSEDRYSARKLEHSSLPHHVRADPRSTPKDQHEATRGGPMRHTESAHAEFAAEDRDVSRRVKCECDEPRGSSGWTKFMTDRLGGSRVGTCEAGACRSCIWNEFREVEPSRPECWKRARGWRGRFSCVCSKILEQTRRDFRRPRVGVRLQLFYAFRDFGHERNAVEVDDGRTAAPALFGLGRDVRMWRCEVTALQGVDGAY